MAKNLIVKNQQVAVWADRQMRCAVGRGGIVPAQNKREGDGATPIGIWPMRGILFRADRVQLPPTTLATQVMQPDDGWCEVPDDGNYNRFVKHPYVTRVDKLWRDDHLYNVIVVLGYNDEPVVKGKGSAIFLHLARHDFSPSAGCITLALQDLMTVVREADPTSAVEIL